MIYLSRGSVSVVESLLERMFRCARSRGNHQDFFSKVVSCFWCKPAINYQTAHSSNTICNYGINHHRRPNT